MKFIVDAQLPISLSDFLNEKSLDSIHTLDLHHFMDVTKGDSEFPLDNSESG